MKSADDFLKQIEAIMSQAAESLSRDSYADLLDEVASVAGMRSDALAND